LKTGIYYSLFDWHHPDYVIDHPHPLREDPAALEMNKKRSMDKYCDYFHGQVKELLTEFGKVDIMWFDMSFEACEYELSQGFKGKGKEDWQSEKLIEMIRGIQPEILLNNRLDVEQDITTPEQFMPRGGVKRDGDSVVWETCQTLNGSWGYNPNATDWKSPEQLIQILVNAVASGGNLLMNISPTGQGDIDEKTLECLDVYAKWMDKNSDSIYGCGESLFPAPEGCRYTQNGKKLYLHIFNWPFRDLHLDGLDGKIEYAQMLHDASEVKFTESGKYEKGSGNSAISMNENSVVFNLPIKKPAFIVPVVEIFLKPIREKINEIKF
jgi:alpha-L-fucosidase